MILLTGGTGFLGGIIQAVLANEEVVLLGRRNSNILCDLSKEIPELPSLDLVIHAAGKAHSVPKTFIEKQAFFDINVQGTKNLLKGLEQAPTLPKSFVFISSIAVYGAESGLNISEDEPLNAKDPYGLSKIQAEHLIIEWCLKHRIAYGIIRLPLLVGANPPGNLRAMINGIKKGYYFNIAGGKAKKSMVLAEDVAHIIPKLANIGGIYNLTDGYHPSFEEISVHIAKQMNKRKVLNIPYWLARLLAAFGDVMVKFPINSRILHKMNSDLIFDDTKARKLLDWKPKKVLKSFRIGSFL
jgi:nucleoside-diphosphate-sugar epimerase